MLQSYLRVYFLISTPTSQPDCYTFHRAVIRQFSSKRDCGEFDQEGAVFATHIDKYQDKIVVLIAGPELGDLVAYDLSKKSLNPDKAYGFLIKSKNRIRIPKAEREKLEKLACNNNDAASGNNGNNSSNRLEYMRVQLICSADFDYAIVVYQNIEMWAVYLYHIYHGRRLGSYVAQVSNYLHWGSSGLMSGGTLPDLPGGGMGYPTM